MLTGDFPGGLKDVNTTRCDVKQAFVDSYARWIELTDADGFRIDTVKHVEHEFWRYFTQRVRQRLAAQGKNKFFMFGEAFDGRDDLVGSFTKNDLPSDEELARENSCDDGPKLSGDQLDSAFYFPQHYQVFRDVFQDGASTDRIANLWANKTVNYGTVAPKDSAGIAPHKVLVNFIDNHDVARFLYFARERVDAHPAFAGKSVRDKELRLRAMLQNALLMLMTAEGVPCLYYGTELEYRGGNDPSNREDMWRPYPYLGETTPPPAFDTTGPTFVFTRKLLEYRKKLAALRRGDTKVVWSTTRTGDESDAGIFAFERAGGEAGNNYVLVVFNTNQNHDSRTQFEGAAMTVSAPPARSWSTSSAATRSTQSAPAAPSTSPSRRCPACSSSRSRTSDRRRSAVRRHLAGVQAEPFAVRDAAVIAGAGLALEAAEVIPRVEQHLAAGRPGHEFGIHAVRRLHAREIPAVHEDVVAVVPEHVRLVTHAFAGHSALGRFPADT
ncbi:alpha-amylase family glycosyl hydrolase [Nannocystis pusilla]|uniref:alpha-amylase family glycosyl hydrolase n=1 Tax=Nannocystis pusilla TaxID=889268 RepID=UPI003B7728E1